MLLTKEQISEQMRKHAEKKNGLHDLMEIMRSHVAGGVNIPFTALRYFKTFEKALIMDMNG